LGAKSAGTRPAPLAGMARPVARVELSIRKPGRDVFRAFVEPAWLERFWLEKSSGPLVLGERVEWEFLVPGVKATARVTALEENRFLAIEWDDGTRVEWTFDERENGVTVVRIENSGFAGNEDEAVATAIESTQGFAIVLCDLKVLLETGQSPNLVRDKASLIHSRAH
jgi:uncharacterized protein YndB with AHSA1/START domain